MIDDNKRLSTDNLLDTENRISALEGNTPETHSGTFRKQELVDMDDRLTVLEGNTPEPHNNEMRISDLLYLDDRCTELEGGSSDKYTITIDPNEFTVEAPMSQYNDIVITESETTKQHFQEMSPITVNKGESIDLSSEDFDPMSWFGGVNYDAYSYSLVKDDDSTNIQDEFTPTEDTTLFVNYAKIEMYPWELDAFDNSIDSPSSLKEIIDNATGDEIPANIILNNQQRAGRLYAFDLTTSTQYSAKFDLWPNTNDWKGKTCPEATYLISVVERDGHLVLDITEISNN